MIARLVCWLGLHSWEPCSARMKGVLYTGTRCSRCRFVREEFDAHVWNRARRRSLRSRT